MKKIWADPEYKKRVSAKISDGWTDDSKKKQSQRLRDMYADSDSVFNSEDHRRKLSAALKAAWQNPDTRERHIASIPDAVIKSNETKRKQKTFNTSSNEDAMYTKLVDTYGADNVIRQYSDDRYPFSCDYYIPSEDLFIELNAHWTHGPKPFDPSDEECLELLDKWRSKHTKFYDQAIYVWTDLDVRKYQAALENNLNYERIYN